MVYEEYWLTKYERALGFLGENNNVYSIDAYLTCNSVSQKNLPSLCIENQGCLEYELLGSIDDAEIEAIYYIDPNSTRKQLISVRAKTQKKLSVKELEALREKVYEIVKRECNNDEKEDNF